MTLLHARYGYHLHWQIWMKVAFIHICQCHGFFTQPDSQYCMSILTVIMHSGSSSSCVKLHCKLKCHKMSLSWIMFSNDGGWLLPMREAANTIKE